MHCLHIHSQSHSHRATEPCVSGTNCAKKCRQNVRLPAHGEATWRQNQRCKPQKYLTICLQYIFRFKQTPSFLSRLAECPSSQQHQHFLSSIIFYFSPILDSEVSVESSRVKLLWLDGHIGNLVEIGARAAKRAISS